MITYKQGNLRADKIEYHDGIGCCVWYPIDDKTEDAGVCFDFDFSDIDNFIALLQQLKDAPAEKYEDEE